MTQSPDFAKKSVAELRVLAEALEIEGFSKLKKAELIEALVNASNQTTNKIPESDNSVEAQEKPKRKRRRVTDSGDEDKTSSITSDEKKPVSREKSIEVDKVETETPEIKEGRRRNLEDRPNREHRKRDRQSEDSAESDNDSKNTKEEKPESEEQKRRKEKLKLLTEMEGVVTTQGVLETVSDGYGFLRSPDYNYQPSPDDVYVPSFMIKQNGLKVGDTIREAFVHLRIMRNISVLLS